MKKECDKGEAQMSVTLLQLIEEYGEASYQYGYWCNFGTAFTLGSRRVTALERIKKSLKEGVCDSPLICDANAYLSGGCGAKSVQDAARLHRETKK